MKKICLFVCALFLLISCGNPSAGSPDDTDNSITDTTPPGEVTGIAVSHDGQHVNLSWTNPGDDDFDKVYVYDNDNGDILAGNSVDGYGNPLYITDGTVTLDNLGWREYTLRISAVDTNGNISSGVTVPGVWKHGDDPTGIFTGEMFGYLMCNPDVEVSYTSADFTNFSEQSDFVDFSFSYWPTIYPGVSISMKRSTKNPSYDAVDFRMICGTYDEPEIPRLDIQMFVTSSGSIECEIYDLKEEEFWSIPLNPVRPFTNDSGVLELGECNLESYITVDGYSSSFVLIIRT